MNQIEHPAKNRIEVAEVSDDGDLETIYQIRDAVFINEQRLTNDTRHDPDDRRSIHYLAFLDGQPVGTGRLTILGREAQIAWVAVYKQFRGEGLGWALMTTMLDRSEREPVDYVILNAQVHALEFYRRLGFDPVGQQFSMSSIEHQVMVRSVSPGGGNSVRNYFDQFNRGQAGI